MICNVGGNMDLLPLKHICDLNNDGAAVRAVRFNADGEYCMTCGSDKTVKLWNPYKNILLKTYSGHGYEVLDCASSLDNSRLVSCSADKTVVLWDVGTGKVIRKFRGHIGVSFFLYKFGITPGIKYNFISMLSC